MRFQVVVTKTRYAGMWNCRILTGGRTVWTKGLRAGSREAAGEAAWDAYQGGQ